MSQFWEKVGKCKHENLSPNYCQSISCSTPYCSGHEKHCLDCGAYITTCGCGACNGMSGWPYKRIVAVEHIMERRVNLINELWERSNNDTICLHRGSNQ